MGFAGAARRWSSDLAGSGLCRWTGSIARLRRSGGGFVFVFRLSAIRCIEHCGYDRHRRTARYPEENARQEYVAVVALYSGKARRDNRYLGSRLALEAAAEVVGPNPAPRADFRGGDSSGEAVA